MTEANRRRDQPLAAMYESFRETVVRSGFGPELHWQAGVDLDVTTETHFLREAAWVVLTTGFNERVIRHRFRQISEAFFDWSSAQRVSEAKCTCRPRALAVFSNRAKIDAIIEIAEIVAEAGFPRVKNRIRSEGVRFLQELPYIGPVTSFHLAKNIGLAVVKPDRHLVRLSRVAGCKSPSELCSQISQITGDGLAVVDLVLWRFATLQPDYEARAQRLLAPRG